MIAAVVASAVLISRPGRPENVGKNVPVLETAASSAPPKNIPIVENQRVRPRTVVQSGADRTPLTALLQVWVAEADPDRKAELETQLEAMLTDSNAAEILRALPQDLLATPFAEAALRHWVHANRKDAAEWVAQQSGLTEPEQTSVIYGWGAEDKNALDDYLNNLPASEWKQSAMKFAANDALAAGSPKDAIDLLVQMDRTRARDDLFNWSATAWAQSDAAAALKWADSLQDVGVRQSALGAIAVGLAWSDPQAAGKLLAEQVQPGEILDRSAMSVACVWSQTDPESAANWVAVFPEGKLQETVLEVLIQRWAAQDLPAAKTWVNELPASATRDTAQKFYADAAANLQRQSGQEAPPQ